MGTPYKLPLRLKIDNDGCALEDASGVWIMFVHPANVEDSRWMLGQVNTHPRLVAELRKAKEALEEHVGYAFSGDEMRLSLIAMNAYDGKNEAANAEFERTRRVDAAKTKARTALASITATLADCEPEERE